MMSSKFICSRRGCQNKAKWWVCISSADWLFEMMCQFHYDAMEKLLSYSDNNPGFIVYRLGTVGIEEEWNL